MAPDQAISNWKKLVFATVVVAGVFLIVELALYVAGLQPVDVGHNEFLERRTYKDILATPRLIAESASLVRRTRIATAVDIALR